MEENYRQVEINGALVGFYQIESLEAVSIDIRIKAGSWYEEDNKWGKAHLLEHMMFQQTKKFAKSSEMEVFKEENGIWSNAMTSGQKIELMMRMPKESIQAGLLLIEEMLFNVVISEDKFSKEKKVIEQEYEDKWSSPNVRYGKKIDEQYFGKGHRYTRDGLGDKEYIATISKSELEEYRDEMIVPQNMIIGVAGNFNFEEMERGLRKILVSKGAKVEENFENTSSETNKVVYIEPGMLAVTVDLGWLTDGMEKTTYEERLMMEIAAYIIGGSPRSILFNKIREEFGMAYGVSMHIGFYQVAGWISVNLSVKPENVDRVILEVNSVLEDFIKLPIEEKVFERAKKYMVMHEKLRYESTMAVAGNISGDLFWEKRVVFPKEYARVMEKITEDLVRKTMAREIGGKKPLIAMMKSE